MHQAEAGKVLTMPEKLPSRPAYKPVAPNQRSIQSDVYISNGQVEAQPVLDSLTTDQRQELFKRKFFIFGQETMFSDVSSQERFDGFVKALILLDVPKKKAYRLTAKPSELDEYIQRITEAKTLLASPAGEITRFKVELMMLGWDFWILHWFYPEYSRVNWCLDKTHFDNDIEKNCGYWQFYHLGADKTLVEYGISVKTSLPIPQSWEDHIQRLELPKTAWAYKKYIQQSAQ